MTKKKIIIGVIFIVVIILVSILAYIYSQEKHSLEAINELLSSPKKSSNIYLTYETKQEGENTVVDVYMKENFYYIVSKNADSSEIKNEAFYNPETEELVYVQNYEPKSIITISQSEQDMYNSYFNNESYFSSSHSSEEYEYLGKEEVNGKQCLKVCFTNNATEKIYYYIDLEDNRIIKEEIYDINENGEWDKKIEGTYSYSYDIVKDTDIHKFDSSSYPNYIVTEIQK